MIVPSLRRMFADRLVLISAQVDAAALGTSFAVDVGVDVLFQVADDSCRQTGQGAGIDAAIVGGAEGQEGEGVAEEGRSQCGGELVGAENRGVEEERIGEEELGRVRVGEVVGGAEVEVGEVGDIRDGAALLERRLAGLVGDSDVVDDEAVVGVVRLNGAEVGFGGVEVIVEAGVVEDPEVGDDVGDDASAAIAVDDVVEDEGGRSVGGGGGVGAGAEVEDDAVAVGVVGALVDFAGDDVVGDEVVEAGVGIEPLVGVEGDGAGPAVVGGEGGGGRDVAVVGDEVVVGGEVIAVDGSDAGAAGVGDGVGDKAEVVGATAEEAVGGVAVAVENQTTEFKVGGVGGEGSAAEVEHGGSVGGAGPEEVDGGGVVVLIDDPGGRGAGAGRVEGGGEVVGTAEEADAGAGLGGSSGAGEGFGRRGRGAGVGVTARGRSVEGAVVPGWTVVHNDRCSKGFQQVHHQQGEDGNPQGK